MPKSDPSPCWRKSPPPAWSLLFTGLVTGMAIGVFGCVLFYLSGNVPPLQGIPGLVPASAQAEQPAAASNVATPDSGPAAPGGLQLEFYNALPDYEVVVNATPVDMTPEQIANQNPVAGNLDPAIMLQIGAYERLQNAQTQQAQLQSMGLNVVIKEEPRPGKVLLLVQAGPYQDRQLLAQAESILRANNIASRRISLTSSAPQ